VHHEAPRFRAVDRVAACYRDAGPLFAAYISAKLRIDPIHAAALDLVPPHGHVIDLGCGSGQLALLLASSAPGRAVTGLDASWARIARGRRAAQLAGAGAQVRYLVSDVRTAPLPSCQAALMVDLLHSLLPAEQDALLRRATRSLEPGGVLLVRDVDRSMRPRWRVAAVALEEMLAGMLGWATGGGGLWFRRASELAAVLSAEGLKTEVRPMWGRTPYANVLIVARR